MPTARAAGHSQGKYQEIKSRRKQVPGSTSLMLLEGYVGGVRICLGVRNSGTETKTSVSLRLSTGWESVFNTDPSLLVSCLCDVLSERMCR